jgi:hypothetical protein
MINKIRDWFTEWVKGRLRARIAQKDAEGLRGVQSLLGDPVATIKDTVDAFVAEHKGKLKNRQDQYRAKHGSYWQGPMTPEIAPDNGVDVAPDLTRKAVGFRSGWSHLLKGANAWPASWPFQANVDTYSGPNGDGWTLTTRFTKNGKTYIRVRDFGPAGLDSGWGQVPDPIVIEPPVEDEDLP